MPVYDYQCDACGPFVETRPMAECEEPCPCPGCGAAAARAYLTAPRLGTMSSERRAAFATNERSTNAPRLSSSSDNAHGATCACCNTRASRFTKYGKSGSAKGFPTKRPWMISH